MKISILSPVLNDGTAYAIGDVVDMDKADALLLLDAGAAEVFDAKAAKAAAAAAAADVPQE